MVYLSEQHDTIRAKKASPFFFVQVKLSVNVRTRRLFWGAEFNIHELDKICIYMYINGDLKKINTYSAVNVAQFISKCNEKSFKKVLC